MNKEPLLPVEVHFSPLQLSAERSSTPDTVEQGTGTDYPSVFSCSTVCDSRSSVFFHMFYYHLKIKKCLQDSSILYLGADHLTFEGGMGDFSCKRLLEEKNCMQHK